MARIGARLLAPIALAAAITATYLIVHKGLATKHTTTRSHVVIPQTTTGAGQRRKPSPKRKFYIVQSGDSLSTISVKTGISVPSLEALNPNVDPNALQTGQKLRLRR